MELADYHEKIFEEILNLIKDQGMFNMKINQEDKFYFDYALEYCKDFKMNSNNINLELTLLKIVSKNNQKEENAIGVLKLLDQENKEIVTLTYGLNKKEAYSSLEGLREVNASQLKWEKHDFSDAFSFPSLPNNYVLLSNDLTFTPQINAFVNDYVIEDTSEIFNHISLSTIKHEIEHIIEKRHAQELADIKEKKEIKEEKLTASVNDVLKKIENIKMKSNNQNNTYSTNNTKTVQSISSEEKKQETTLRGKIKDFFKFK